MTHKVRLVLYILGGMLLSLQTSLASTRNSYVLDAPFVDAEGGSHAAACNDRGDVVGVIYDEVGGARSFKREANGKLIYIQVPNTRATIASGINDSGHVVGSFVDGEGIHGFLYDGESFAKIDAPLATKGSVAYGINNLDEVVGYFSDDSGTHGFVFSNGAFTSVNVPRAVDSVVFGINDHGSLVGTYRDREGVHSFVSEGGRYETINPPAGASVILVRGINNARHVVGVYYDAEGTHGFLSSSAGFMKIELQVTQGRTVIFGLNNKDQIAGDYFDGYGHGHGGLASVDNAIQTGPPQ